MAVSDLFADKTAMPELGWDAVTVPGRAVKAGPN
jgi:hypothetical protein